MSPPKKTGPRPQDKRVVKALGTFIDGAIGVVTGIMPGGIDDALARTAEPKLRELALKLLGDAGVDTAGLTIHAPVAPKVKRITREVKS